ncbi:sulfoacetaldehyde dehydrogenase [Chromatiales bacterium (ex Bugula neritina AB1)]|nr:sulfoacetaldehyde dehydrogenase [Chromatiales bacterium (ex Bugula neritina AB1)]
MGARIIMSETNSGPGDANAAVAKIIENGRQAMKSLTNADQARVDEAVTALAWAVYEPGRARELAELAVTDTGMGNVDSKIIKNTRKTFGTLRDLIRAQTVGIIERDEARGMVKYAKPVGVVGAVTPSTNPAATPVNKAMMAVKGRNAVIIAGSPAGFQTTLKTVNYMREQLEAIGLPADLVQMLPPPVNKEMTQELMQQCDLVVVTGSQNNVKRAYSSGTPAIGVGAGNVAVMIASSAELDSAAEKICASKIFDNSTSCSSENSVTIVDEIYDDAITALQRAGGYMCNADERQKIIDTLWVNGNLNRKVIAKDADILADVVGLPEAAKNAKFFMVEETGVGADFPLSNEKLSLVLTVYRAADYKAAKARLGELLEYAGMGHSVGIHTNNIAEAQELAEDLNVVRVLVNQAHTFGNGGSFTNGFEFTLSMGCGSWAGNSISENLNYKHFINITHLSTEIPEDKPSEQAMFGSHWEKYGRQ